jgi:hypothetical protein
VSDTMAPRPIAKALAAAQSEIADPVRSKEMKVPGRPSRMYAGLDDLFRAVRGPLTKHGIAISQAIEQREGRMFLVSRLLHESGDTLASEWELDWKGGPQDKGSALTYAKRYTLAGLCGVADVEDDDAESVQHPPPLAQAEQKPRPRAKNQNIPTEPSPEDQRAADEVFEARRQAEAQRKAKHHPSFTDGERRSYSAAVSTLGFDVDLVAELAESMGRPRPSAMEPVQRAKFVEWLGTDKGRSTFADFQIERTERLARETA